MYLMGRLYALFTDTFAYRMVGPAPPPSPARPCFHRSHYRSTAAATGRHRPTILRYFSVHRALWATTLASMK